MLAIANVAKDLFSKKDGSSPGDSTKNVFGSMVDAKDPMTFIGGAGASALKAYDMFKNPNKAIGGLIGDEKMGNNLYDLYMGRRKKEV